jgi:hypothetical protein
MDPNKLQRPTALEREIFFGMIFVGTIIVTLVTQVPLAFELTRDGMEGEAEVIFLENSKSARMQYLYTVDGQRYIGKGSPSEGHPSNEQLRLGSPISITYSARRPWISEPGRPHNRLIGAFLGSMGAGLGLAVFLTLYFWNGIQVRRRWWS